MSKPRARFIDHSRDKGYRRRLAARGHRPLRLRSGDDLRCLPPLPRRGRCVATGKIRYFDAETAELVLAGIGAHNPRRREQRAYRCPECSGWHLTSQAGNTATGPTPAV